VQEIDDAIHALPNMKGAETWISPFSKHEGTVKFLWPHYCLSKGRMVEVTPKLQVEAPDMKELLDWKDIEKGTVLRIKVTLLVPCFN